MRGERSKRKLKAEINVVPYIDVMLVLLIIFMVASPMTNPSVINLPTAGQSTQPPNSFIEVTLKQDASASISLNTRNGNATQRERTDEVRNKEQLMNLLKEYHQSKPDLAVMISADKGIVYDDVVQVIAEAKKIGISRVALATR
ncbi:ExbD/TolR family protein [Undibacterium sp. LFS511W]|uniref:ExbD/TolR family protein n=1 Tax=Undibacterium luofuense TaxID=2828733 RepID=A0A941DI10_9BURK|nr:ExbD/TolR family protein [Undibacterium luofuense]MBR7781307.1 ExbD/TolR family protein [Undibacterium luofuense]